MCNISNIDTNQSNNDNLSSEMLDNGGFSVNKCGKNIHCLTIIGQIEGHYLLPPTDKTTKYEHVIPQLISVEEDDEIDGLLVILNTVGGDVEAGLAIAELISGINKPTASLILGGGHSIGVPLAVKPAVAVAAPVAGAAAGDAAPANVTVSIADAGAAKVAVIKVVKEITGLGLVEAKGLADKGGNIKENVSADEANELKAKLEEAGATIELV